MAYYRVRARARARAGDRARGKWLKCDIVRANVTL